MGKIKSIVTWIIVLHFVFCSAIALAQTDPLAEKNFPAERFRPATGTNGIFDTEIGQTPEAWSWDVGLWLGYANDPLVLRRRLNGVVEERSLVAHRLGANIVGSLSPARWIVIGLDVPVALYQTADKGVGVFASGVRSSKVTTAGFGNLRLVPKVSLLQEAEHFVSVAFLASLSLPTKTSSAYFGDSGLGFTPEVAVSRKILDFTLAGNLSYLARKKKSAGNLTVDDELGFHLGLAYDMYPLLHKPMSIGATLNGAALASNLFGQRNESPLEALLGVSATPIAIVDVLAAFGFGLSRGYGTPDFRILAGVKVRNPLEIEPPLATSPTPPAPEDQDGDKVTGSDDQCPEIPEDVDGFSDSDGCADPDNDGDGILDVADKCPNDAENKNAWQDDDGCPDDDDSDKDGIRGASDQCPDDAEDKDKFEDSDGCADPDNDKDGVADHLDVCPNEAGDPNFQGCKAVQKVKLSGGKIELLEKVYFVTAKSTIEARSIELLNNVGRVLSEHPEIARVRVEGHTDDRGDAQKNKDLSQSRADAVKKFLVDKGIASSRLEAVGFGEEKPIASNKDEKGRSINRRVEFVIVE